MKPQLHIQIPEPCHQPWQHMPEVEAGKRHCGACNRILTDFSQWSDEQLIHFFTHTNEKFCGRFSESQLNRNIIPTTHKKRWWPQLVVPAFLFTATLSAQQGSTTKAVSQQIVQHPKFQIRISGFVLLADSLKAQGATIRINNGADTVNAVTDANGYFVLTMKASANDTLHTSVRLAGYNTQNATIIVTEGQLNYVMNVRMQEVVVVVNHVVIIGDQERYYTGIAAEYEVIEPVKKQTSLRHFFHRLFHPFKHKHRKKE